MKNIYIYELFLKDSNVDIETWDNYLKNIGKFLGFFSHFKIVIKLDYNKVRYFLIVKSKLSNSFNIDSFLLKLSNESFNMEANYQGFKFCLDNNTLLRWNNYFYKHNKNVKLYLFNVRYFQEKIKAKVYVFYEYDNKLYYKRIYLIMLAKFLSIDFSKNKSLFYTKCPKYLKIDKILYLLTTKAKANFLVDTFPYFNDDFYLKYDCYDFYKHSLVIGSSGSGKSKFLAKLISDICLEKPLYYKIVLIDPHDSLKKELWQIDNSKVIDFKQESNSIELFKSNFNEINATVELTLSLFSTLIDNYNSKLERVLRFSTYILISDNSFSFLNLRKLLLDLDYRNMLVSKLKKHVVPSVLTFFLNDFNEIKNQYYGDAIAPIIAFIDEMQMVPVFNLEKVGNDVLNILQNNVLTIFSLNRLNLGDKVIKVISGFILQQIFLIAQTGNIKEHLIVVIDEVSILENPILARFLSEMRKFNVSVILACQYFHQISDNLREAILANTSNYYLFKTSKTDALILNDNLDIKLENSNSVDDKINFLTNLKARECLIQINKNGTNYPMFKAKTMDFFVPDYKEVKNKNVKEKISEEKFEFDFKVEDVDIHDVMKNVSTSRKSDLK
ncbi:MAG: ATP-binding protein [Bacilli bacterium]|jgi:hypothetical protein|nr:ATP-binding protein [Bacilli bacterium]